MNILEVRNNLLKISYEEDLKLGSFILIKGMSTSYIAQVLHVESNRIGKIALAKLIYLYDGALREYDGSVPSVRSSLEEISPNVLVEGNRFNAPLLLGEIAQTDVKFLMDKSGVMENKLLICSDSNENTELMIENLSKQLSQMGGRKVVVIDNVYNGDSVSQLVGGKNFKLPLNNNALDFIYEKGMPEANVEGLAVLSEIFAEIREYMKTVPYVPFSVFRQVVEGQYEQTKMLQLVLLNNKLKKFDEQGIFARQQDDYSILDKTIQDEDLIRVDLSGLDDAVQHEFINYIYSRLSCRDEKFYVILRVNNNNSDKKMLKQFLFAQNMTLGVACSYNYKYLTELKQLVDDILLFAPRQTQSDFTAYNVFLNKLLNDEYVIFGKSTKYVPFILKLRALTEAEISALAEVKSNEESFTTEHNDVEYVETDFGMNELGVNQTEDVFVEEVEGIEVGLNDVEPISETEVMPTVEVPEVMSLTDEDIAEQADKIFSGKEIDIADEGEFSDDDLDFVEGLGDDFEIVEPATDMEAIEIVEDEITTDEISEYEPVNESELEAEEDVSELPMEEDIAEEEENPLPTKSAVSQAVPIYSAEIPKEDMVESDAVEVGDIVIHPKHGRGMVEKMINYGNKSLCFISFETAGIGKRLIDPSLELLKKA